MESHDPLRIAAWSGPRNISTAMMRSWENRPDTIVCDEPLYAYYLSKTGLDHPAREDVIAHHGDSQNPASREELIGKFSFLVEDVLSADARARVTETVSHLDALGSIRELTRLLHHN